MHSFQNYSVEISYQAKTEISKFYNNAARKHESNWGKDFTQHQIRENIRKLKNPSLYIPIKEPLLYKWKNYQRIKIDRWNYAIQIIDNKITIVDACHQQNMVNKIDVNDNEEEEQQPNVNPRITDITLRERRDNRFLIKCKIDGEEQLFEVVTDDDSNLYRAKQITAEQLAEKYFKNALDQSIDLDHIVHFKR